MHFFFTFVRLTGAGACGNTHTGIGKDDRCEDQVGKNKDQHANTRGDGQILNHLNLNNHQHGKADAVG